MCTLKDWTDRVARLDSLEDEDVAVACLLDWARMGVCVRSARLEEDYARLEAAARSILSRLRERGSRNTGIGYSREST